jgi:hypothetical protein
MEVLHPCCCGLDVHKETVVDRRSGIGAEGARIHGSLRRLLVARTGPGAC